MKDNFVITIGREFGSQGHTIGEKLAQRLQVPLYDKNIVKEAAKKSGYDENLFEQIDEKRTTSLLFSIAMNLFPYTSKMERLDEFSFADKLYVIQKNIIEEFAQKGSCVIVGRCSNYILKEYENGFHIFIYCDRKKRIEYVCKKYKMNEKEAEELIHKMDKKRSSYYNYYTGSKWGSKYDYDLLFNSSKLTADEITDILEQFIKKSMHFD